MRAGKIAARCQATGIGHTTTWLEDAAIPHATPAMLARVTAALDERIGRALAVAAYLLRERPDCGRSVAERASDLGWS